MSSGTVHSIVKSLQATTSSPRELAVALHNYVRDDVAFGFTNRFDLATAEHTLQQKRGHCTPKTNLFVHLLREAGFDDATVVAVPIPNSIFDGMGGSFPSTVHHSFTEVTVDGNKCRVDSYVTDKALFQAAQKKLEGASNKLGYAIHKDGTIEWDGVGDAFSQYFVQTPEKERRHETTAEMVADAGYYEHASVASMLRVPVLGWLLGSLVSQNNGPVERLRQSL